MKSIKQIFLVVLVLHGFDLQIAYSQAFQKILNSGDYSGDFIKLSNKANRFYDTATGNNRSGYKQWKRFEWFALHHLNQDGSLGNYPQKNIAALQSFNQLKTNTANLISSATGNWINIGHESAPGGSSSANQGRVNSIAFDPVNGDVIYIGAAAGGIWKTTNGGSSWTNLTIDLPILGIADIAVSPAPNNNIIYALSGEGISVNVYLHKGIGIIKSIDGGLSWQTTGPVYTLSQQTGGNKLLIHPANSNYVLAAMSNGLFRTIDGGNVWNLIAPGDINDIEFKPNDANILYVTTRGNSNLEILNLTTLDQTNIGIVPPPSPPVNSPPVTRMEIGVTPANGNAVYVLAGPGYVSGNMNLFRGLFYSNNGGMPLPNGSSSFTQRTNNSCCHLFGAVDFEVSGYANTIYVNPFNENNVIVGGLGVFTSTDGGATLNLINDLTIHADQHNLKRNPVTNDLWLCNDGGVYISTNSGVDWNNASSGLTINEYYRISGTQTITDHLIGGLQDIGHTLREPGTNIFRTVMNNDGMDNYFNSYNNDIVYACTQNGGLNRSTNAGFNFVPVGLPNANSDPPSSYSWITPIVQHPPDLTPPIGNFDIIYVYGQNGILQSKDGGPYINMGPAGIGGSSPSMAIGSHDLGATANLYISNGNNFWVHENPWFATTTGWVNRPLPIAATLNISAIAVNPANKNEVWVTISGYTTGQKVYRSTNAGATWSNLSLSLPNTPVYSIVFANNNNSPNGAVYVGTEIGVFYTNDFLPDWVPFSNGLPHVPVTDLQMNYVNSTLKAATYGRGIWQSDLFQNCSPALTINYDIYQGQYSYEASGTITANAQIHGGIGTRVTMKAGTRITFQPGFRARTGVYMRAKNGNCGTGVLRIGDSLDVKTENKKILSDNKIDAAPTKKEL